MNDFIAVPIPVCESDEEIDYLEYLKDFDEQLSLILDFKVDDGDCRTSCVGYQITDVTVCENRISIDYEISTHTYYGCKDMDSDGCVYRAVTGVSKGNHWLFKPSLCPDPRSTFEEF